MRRNNYEGSFFLSSHFYFLLILDAAKRRALPLWIREGLEKMEREKQKQLEKEQLKQQKDAMLKEGHKKKKAANEANPSRSKFVSCLNCVLKKRIIILL